MPNSIARSELMHYILTDFLFILLVTLIFAISSFPMWNKTVNKIKDHKKITKVNSHLGTLNFLTLDFCSKINKYIEIFKQVFAYSHINIRKYFNFTICVIAHRIKLVIIVRNIQITFCRFNTHFQFRKCERKKLKHFFKRFTPELRRINHVDPSFLINSL